MSGEFQSCIMEPLPIWPGDNLQAWWGIYPPAYPQWAPHVPTTTTPLITRLSDRTGPAPTREGWRCPGCGSCYGPHVDRCEGCGSE